MSIHVNALGVSLEWIALDNGSPLDVSLATFMEVKILKPNGVQLTRDLSLITSGADGRVRYLTQVGDFDVPGLYEWQIHITIPPWRDHSDKGSFIVKENLWV